MHSTFLAKHDQSMVTMNNKQSDFIYLPINAYENISSFGFHPVFIDFYFVAWIPPKTIRYNPAIGFILGLSKIS